MEWSDLATKSLPTLSAPSGSSSAGATGAPTLQWRSRPLPALQVAGESLLYSQSAGAPAPTDGAQAILGSWSTHVPLSTPGQHQQTAGSSTGERAAPISNQRQSHGFVESLEDLVAREEQALIDRTLQALDDEMVQKRDALVENQIQKGWEKQREEWIKELVGTRTLGGVAGTTGTTPLRQIGTGNDALLLQGPSNAMSTIPPYAMTTATGRSNASRSGSLMSPSQFDMEMVKQHLAVVQQLDLSKPAVRVVEQFENLVDSATPFATAVPVLQGYRSAWQLVSHLVQAHVDSPEDLARAALVHLCEQFRVVVEGRVRSAATAGVLGNTASQSTYGSELANQCVSFCKLTLGVDNIAVSPGVPQWSVLYYCLRCGDAVAAREVWQRSTSGGDEGEVFQSVHRILDAMAKEQRSARCMWEINAPRLDVAERRVVLRLLESVKNSTSTDSDTANTFQAGVYALLCGMAQLPIADTTIGLRSIEDYLTGELWKALLYVPPLGQSTTMKNPIVEELTKLGQFIKSSGPAHFEGGSGGDAAGGWPFAVPLLLTQQFWTALKHLAVNGGAMGQVQSTHLAMVLASSGIRIQDLGKSETMDSNDFVPLLLVDYTTNLATILSPFGEGSLAALEYLVRIPNDKNKALARQHVAGLIANWAGDTQRLVGGFDASGIRHSGALDDHFTRAEVSDILVEAASQLVHRGSRQTMGEAAMCLMLAERYDDVLGLLNERLSPPEQPDVDRNFWMEQTQSFHTQYLTGNGGGSSSTHVLEVLERQGKLSLVQTSRMMMDLNNFFGWLAAGRYDQASAIAEQQLYPLFPRSDEELAIKGREYGGLDPLIQRALPAFFVGVMTNLQNQHAHQKNALQQQQGHVAADVARERLRELQLQARLLITFAGIVGFSGDSVERLSQASALMI